MDSSEKLDKLIAHYSENYEILYNVILNEQEIPVMAHMSNRKPVSIMGFTVNTKKLGPEACERLFFMNEDVFDLDALERVKAILNAAESEYVNLGSDHAFTFLSAVVIADKAEANAVNALKKYNVRRDYKRDGWVLLRTVVLAQDGEYCNKDGKDLKTLIQNIIKREAV